MTGKRKTYSREYKIEAVRMMKSEKTATQVARELGVSLSLLYSWRKALEKDELHAFPGNGKQTPEQAELTRLRIENEQLRQERDFLKKTAAYFAKESK